MMQLFGGFSEEAYEAYNDVYPLVAGWKERVPIFQLAPLLVHAIKFGGSYVRATHQAIDKILAL